jgi:hypothetical protein
MAQILMANGADISIPDSDGCSAEFAAEKKGYFSLANDLHSFHDFYRLISTPSGVRTEKKERR